MFYDKWQQLGNCTGILQLEITLVNTVWLVSNPLWMEKRRLLIHQSGFGFFGFQIQWILFQKGFTGSKIRIWFCRKEREIRFGSKIHRKEYTINHVGCWFYTGRWTFTRVSPEQMCKYWEKHVATAGFFLTNWKLLNNCCRNFRPAVVNWKDHKNQRKDKNI